MHPGVDLAHAEAQWLDALTDSRRAQGPGASSRHLQPLLDSAREEAVDGRLSLLAHPEFEVQRLEPRRLNEHQHLAFGYGEPLSPGSHLTCRELKTAVGLFSSATRGWRSPPTVRSRSGGAYCGCP